VCAQLFVSSWGGSGAQFRCRLLLVAVGSSDLRCPKCPRREAENTPKLTKGLPVGTRDRKACLRPVLQATREPLVNNGARDRLSIPQETVVQARRRGGGVEPILSEACSQGYPKSAICVQKLDDSLNSAIRITYRISLRSSSVREPRYPLLRVVQRFVCFVFVFFFFLHEAREGRKRKT
jgi:hypothetical protein